MMTLVRNRAGRKAARRERALSRLTTSLQTGVRCRRRVSDVLHDNDSRDRANAVADKLVLRIAALNALVGVRTKKDRSGRARFATRPA